MRVNSIASSRPTGRIVNEHAPMIAKIANKPPVSFAFAALPHKSGKPVSALVNIQLCRGKRTSPDEAEPHAPEDRAEDLAGDGKVPGEHTVEQRGCDDGGYEAGEEERRAHVSCHVVCVTVWCLP